MALDLWIYGPGYGETIVMAWDDPAKANEKRMAVVDHYGGKTASHSPALTLWKSLNEPVMAFAAATHPHFDHIRALHLVLKEAAIKEGMARESAIRESSSKEVTPQLERIFWWGCFDDH